MGEWVYVRCLLRPGWGFESRVFAIAVLGGFPEEAGQWVRNGEERAHNRWRDGHRSGFKLLLLLLLQLLLLGFVPQRLCLTGCWSVFDACHLRESAVAFMGALDCGLGGMGSVAVVVVNEMVVGGRKMFDMAMQTTVSGTCQATQPYRVLICTLY